MKILFLSTWFPYPPDNGYKIRVYHLLQALGKQHEVTLLSFHFGDTNTSGALGELEECCTEIKTIERNPFERSRLAQMTRFLSRSTIVDAPIPEMEKLVSQTVARTKFDVVIASTTVPAVYALQATAIPVKVLEEHNSFSYWAWERYQRQTTLLGRLRCWCSWQKRRRYESELYRRFDLCTMVSENDKAATLQLLPAEYHHRVAVVPNGVDCDYNRSNLAQPLPNTLIFNGALTYFANYEAMQYFLAEIYPLIRKQCPQVSLTITGSTSGVALTGLQLGDGVRLSGYVKDIRPLVAGAWGCVVPIRQGGGTRLKILEAMALGTPVITTTKGSEGIDAIDGEHLLLADDPASFAACTLRLLHDSTLRQYLATNARQLVEQRYEWSQITQHFVALIEEYSEPK